MAKGLNAQEVLENIDKCIEELDNMKGTHDYDWCRHNRKGWGCNATYSFCIRAVCKELSIFDWWNKYLSLSQLKQMRAFVQTAIKLGFTGYVCFKVGAVGCSHGMWASKEESLDGYSPKGSDTLFHSFRCDENYWSICLNNNWGSCDMKLADVKRAIAQGGV